MSSKPGLFTLTTTCATAAYWHCTLTMTKSGTVPSAGAGGWCGSSSCEYSRGLHKIRLVVASFLKAGRVRVHIVQTADSIDQVLSCPEGKEVYLHLKVIG